MNRFVIIAIVLLLVLVGFATLSGNSAKTVESVSVAEVCNADGESESYLAYQTDKIRVYKHRKLAMTCIVFNKNAALYDKESTIQAVFKEGALKFQKLSSEYVLDENFEDSYAQAKLLTGSIE